MRKHRFIGRVGNKSIRQKRYLILFLSVLSIGAIIFLYAKLPSVEGGVDESYTETQIHEESPSIKFDKTATTFPGVSAGIEVGTEKPYQHPEAQPKRDLMESKTLKQQVSPPSHSSQTGESYISAPSLAGTPPTGNNPSVQPANLLAGPALSMYLRWFPQLTATAVTSPQKGSEKAPIGEYTEAAEEETPLQSIHESDPFLPAARRHLLPLQEVRIQLLRQRVDRRRWAADPPSSTAMDDVNAACEPVVSLTPVESPLLHFPNELLVEEYLPGNAGVNPRPDPRYVIPMTAVAAAAARAERVEAELAERKTSGASQPTAEAADSILFFPQFDSVNTLKSLPRPLIEAVPSEKTKLSPSQLLWRPSRDGKDMAVRVQLFKVKPLLASLSDSGKQPQDLTRTEALAGYFTFHGVKRLYGLPRWEETARSKLGGRLTVQIPLDGFRYTASIKGNNRDGRSLEVGVLPLVFVELDASSSSFSSLPQPRRVVKSRTVGILWFNGAPFSVSTAILPSPLTAEQDGNTNRSFAVQLNFTSSAAATRVYLLPGPTAAAILKQYYTLTGFPTMPPLTALGYHYHTRTPLKGNALAFVRAINHAFWDGGVPLDSIGLTSSTINQHETPFTWDHDVLQDPMRMQIELWYYGRRSFIVRVAPTIPIIQSSPLYFEGRQGGYLVSLDPDDDTWWIAYTKNGRRVHVIDFVNPNARQWFSRMFKYKRFTKSTNFTYVSLQHAAPVLLGTPDSTLPMGVGHTAGLAHRQVHNVFNAYVAMAAHQGMLHRNNYHRRPFVTSENYFIGIHRFSVVFLQYHLAWKTKLIKPALGEAASSSSSRAASRIPSDWAWQQLRHAIEDGAALSAVGIPLIGVNIAGGVSQSETITGSDFQPLEKEELLTRWYQAASVFPLMQTEELVKGSPQEGGAAAASLVLAVRHEGVRAAVRFRYALLPYLYTVLWQMSEEGCPMLFAPVTEVMQKEAYAEGEAVCVRIGSALVACPCVKRLDAPDSWRKAKGRLPQALPGTTYRNYWTGGEWEAGASVPLWTEATTGAKTWLGGEPNPPNHTDIEDPRPSAGSDLPLFQRVGSIVPTFLALGGQMTSTRSPANYSLTIALPNTLRAAYQDSLRNPDQRILLASGEVYWDDGTKNTQIQPPPQKMKSHKQQASASEPVYCHVQLECYLKRGKLMLSGKQDSPSCIDSLKALAFAWNDLPPQMDTWIRGLNEQEDAIRHVQEVKRDEEEDRGLHKSERSLRHNATEAPMKDSVDDAIRDPNTTVRDTLHTAFSLHYVRFLVASPEDGKWLAHSLDLVVEPSKGESAMTLVARPTALSKGEEGNTPSAESGTRSFFGVVPLMKVAARGNQSDYARETSPWVTAF